MRSLITKANHLDEIAYQSLQQRGTKFRLKFNVLDKRLAKAIEGLQVQSSGNEHSDVRGFGLKIDRLTARGEGQEKPKCKGQKR